jgi:hypothetical protein
MKFEIEKEYKGIWLEYDYVTGNPPKSYEYTIKYLGDRKISGGKRDSKLWPHFEVVGAKRKRKYGPQVGDVTARVHEVNHFGRKASKQHGKDALWLL